MVRNKEGVVGLPVRLTVSVIIGGVALATILGFVWQPCLFPDQTIVEATPLVHSVGGGSGRVNINFLVKNSDGVPIKDANVVVCGLEDAVEASTDEKGVVSVSLDVSLEDGRSEGYLDVSVKTSGCYQNFHQEDMIKVVRG
ncbi:MAG: hypothetical protein V5A64_03400 [Candidatus Thermoplasmatota archaeon]